MNAFKRGLILLVVPLWTGVCLALPAPDDIERAVTQGDLSQAEQMLRAVIAEKPDSAKAHYALAQVLAREGQHSQALQAIERARELEPALKFAQSPDKFNAVLQAIKGQADAGPDRALISVDNSSTQRGVSTSAVLPDRVSMVWFWPALLLGGFALLVLAWWRRARSRFAWRPADAGVTEAARGFGAQFDPRGAASGDANPYPSATSSMGSGVTGAVVGGLAGVAAGYVLSKVLESSSASHHEGIVPQPNSAMDDMGVVRLDEASGQDLGQFDAGGGDQWDGPSTDESW